MGCGLERSGGGCLGVRPVVRADVAIVYLASPHSDAGKRAGQAVVCTGDLAVAAGKRGSPVRSAARRGHPHAVGADCAASRVDPVPKPDKPPAANAPASLSGVLSDGERFEAKPDADKLWDGSFNLGLDGSEGNTEAFNFRFGVNAVRKSEFSILTANLDYKKQTSNTQSTVDRLYFESRLERLIAQSRWSLFVHETIEYDRSQPFDVRDTSDAGVGYRLIKSELTTLIGRLGGGFSHEYGGPENGQYIPEAVFGLQLDCQLSKRQKILAAVEYAPDVGDFLRYRIRTQAALEMSIDQEKNLALRMGVLEATIVCRMGLCRTTSTTP